MNLTIGKRRLKDYGFWSRLGWAIITPILFCFVLVFLPIVFIFVEICIALFFIALTLLLIIGIFFPEWVD